MQILLPPSEGKNHPRRGHPLELAGLSFPGLTAKRAQLLEVVRTAAAAPDAATLFGVTAGQLSAVMLNAELPELPTARADRIYDGVLYRALDLAGLDAAGKRRAGRSILISSALFGVLRIGDRIPAYKLSMGAKLPGVGALAGFWRPALAEAMAPFESELLVDCRSGSYAAAWRPNGRAWVQVTVPGATHHAKYTRGLIAHQLCRGSRAPRSPADLADLLGADFTVALTAPPKPGGPWQLAVAAA